ncbi:class I SAM-dependent methyltransferase [Colwelliaceae bacterium BS250]
MSIDHAISAHYLHGNLLAEIERALLKLGKTIDIVTISDLAPVDEFHIGGRIASKHFLEQLNLSLNDHVLDIGCGLGGAARYVAEHYKCKVSGIDLTPEYIKTGQALCAWVKLDKLIDLQQGNALAMPFQANSFDRAYMMHVGMNIEDKQQLFNDANRVLRCGAYFGIYDIMRQQNGDLSYPVPWATTSSISKLATIDEYKNALIKAGFDIISVTDRYDFAIDFFKQMKVKSKANGGPAPLGLHTLMQSSTALKVNNMITNLDKGLIAPIEIIAVKRC